MKKQLQGKRQINQHPAALSKKYAKHQFNWCFAPANETSRQKVFLGHQFNWCPIFLTNNSLIHQMNWCFTHVKMGADGECKKNKLDCNEWIDFRLKI
ncbi:MAG: hypothetical protein IJ333_04940 [Clostridia bacterium]|nr:hypothetical protein [Clostridia bacterium]